MKTLLAIAVGPVQEFIAAARKTRDFWFGSQLLSDISRAVALQVAESCGLDQLVFPAPPSIDVLKPDHPQARDFNVANVILVVVPEALASDIKTNVVEPARKAAMNFWHGQAEKARKELVGKAGPAALRETAWDRQVDDVIEFYAAWTPLEASYRQSRERVMRLLAGRKKCRDFRQFDGSDLDGVPKSSLDGARESVLTRVLAKNPQQMRRLRLQEREQLDCIGLTKRLAPRSWRSAEPHFPSVSRIAAQAWLDGVQCRLSDAAVESAFNQLKSEAQKCHERDVLHKVKDDFFPYEGTIIFRNRYREFASELGDEGEAQRSLNLAAGHVKLLEKAIGEPDPYVAVLLADGDRVGQTLSDFDEPDRHRQFSRKLAEFAAAAKEIVEKKQRGVLIYAGGDDVLAMVPVHCSVACEEELHQAFGKVMQDALPDPVARPRPTLSVGIAIGHFMEPLEFLLGFAHRAEKDAKDGTGPEDQKDGLAIHVHTRGGAPIHCRAQWRTKFGNQTLSERLQNWVKLLMAGGLPHRAAYQLRELSVTFRGWREGAALTQAIRKESLRVLNRKQASDGSTVARNEIKSLLTAIETVDDLRRVADELLVARRLFLAERLANPGNQTGRRVASEGVPA